MRGGYTILIDGRSLGLRARCHCGWTSQRMTTSGLCGTAWDEHVEVDHPRRRHLQVVA